MVIRDIQRKPFTSGNKPFSLNSILWIHLSQLMVNVARPAQTLGKGVCVKPRHRAGRRSLTRLRRRAERFQGLISFSECFKCWLHTLGLWRSFSLLQHCCFEQFCFSSLSFREITSFGILTTNGGRGIFFLICIFRIKYTSSLLFLITKEHTLWKLYHNIWKQHFPLRGDFCTKCKKKKKKILTFPVFLLIVAVHVVVFTVIKGTYWQTQVWSSRSNVCCYDAHGYEFKQKPDPSSCTFWILFQYLCWSRPSLNSCEIPEFCCQQLCRWGNKETKAEYLKEWLDGNPCSQKKTLIKV